MSKVFISYSHDSAEHRAFVLALSNQLRDDGLDCQIDQYVNGFPPEGWPRWMENQLEAADFVLLVCTETYLRRYRGQEIGGGKGVNFEGLVSSQHLYDVHYRNTKFIPVIPETGSFDHVPTPLKGFNTYTLNRDYEELYRYLTQQPKILTPPVKTIKSIISGISNTDSIICDRLPTVKGDFFGRQTELEMLDQAWFSNDTNIIQFIAAGGTGKTKLLRYWLDKTKPIRLVAWSFYSQGSSEDKQTSAAEFFDHILNLFQADKTTNDFVNLPEKLGEYVAKLLGAEQSLLILDGLEPLQYASSERRGAIKDRALKALLKSLANYYNKGLCIITSRVEVYELSGHAFPRVIRHNLHNLRVADGIALLRSLKVTGSEEALTKVIKEYSCHALALSLMGNILRWRFDGDIRQSKQVPELIQPTSDPISNHAFRIMQAYEQSLANEPELAVLYILGLFDHPIAQEVLKLLWDKQVIHLMRNVDEQACWKAIDALREEHHLLAKYVNKSYIDCHPLVKKYFGKQLQKKYPRNWRESHKILYNYYLLQADKELPDTPHEMQPLLNAIEHGCAAGLHQEAFDQIYWPKISREKEFYLSKKGNFEVDLAVITRFFSKPWIAPMESLSIYAKANLLRSAGYRLRALGRIQESIEPFTEEQPFWRELGEPKLYDLVEPHLTLGNIHNGLKIAEEAIKHNYEEFDRLLECTAIYARALHQSGHSKEATRIFINLEKSQSNRKRDLQYLSGLPHFRYCELLLENCKFKQVETRCLFNLRNVDDDLQIGLSQLLLGKSYFLRKRATKTIYIEAENYLNKAINHLHAAGNQDHIPRGLLARAAFYRIKGYYDDANSDLKEVLDIAESSGMRLHLTDYHLEMARLLLAQAKGRDVNSFQQERSNTLRSFPKHIHLSKPKLIGVFDHIAEAERLINATGYHRRDSELAGVKQQLANSV